MTRQLERKRCFIKSAGRSPQVEAHASILAAWVQAQRPLSRMKPSDAVPDTDDKKKRDAA